MKLPKVLVVVFLSCVLLEISAEKEIPSRAVNRSQTKGNRSTKNSPEISRDHSRLDSIILKLEDKLETFDDKIMNILLRLEDLDEKINGIDDNLFRENANDAASPSLSINTRLHLWEQKITAVDHKIDQLINQSDKKLDDSSHHTIDQPLKVKLIEDVLPLDLAIIALQTKEAVEMIGEKIQQNLSENGEKLENLKRYLHVIFDENKNISQTDEILMQIRRKERRIANYSSLITDILSMVRERLKSEKEDDTVKLVETVGSLTDILSNFENLTSPNTTQKIKASAAVRKDGLIFPNIKNKPSKLSTSFVSEAKDAKVS